MRESTQIWGTEVTQVRFGELRLLKSELLKSPTLSWLSQSYFSLTHFANSEFSLESCFARTQFPNSLAVLFFSDSVRQL